MEARCWSNEGGKNGAGSASRLADVSYKTSTPARWSLLLTCWPALIILKNPPLIYKAFAGGDLLYGGPSSASFHCLGQRYLRYIFARQTLHLTWTFSKLSLRVDLSSCVLCCSPSVELTLRTCPHTSDLSEARPSTGWWSALTSSCCTAVITGAPWTWRRRTNCSRFSHWAPSSSGNWTHYLVTCGF